MGAQSKFRVKQKFQKRKFSVVWKFSVQGKSANFRAVHNVQPLKRTGKQNLWQKYCRKAQNNITLHHGTGYISPTGSVVVFPTRK